MAIVPTGRSSAKPSAISTPWKSWNSAWGAPCGQGRALKTTPPPTTLSPFNSLPALFFRVHPPLPYFPLLANGRPRYLSALPTLLIPRSKELDKWNEKKEKEKQKKKKKILLSGVSSGVSTWLDLKFKSVKRQKTRRKEKEKKREEKNRKIGLAVAREHARPFPFFSLSIIDEN